MNKRPHPLVKTLTKSAPSKVPSLVLVPTVKPKLAEVYVSSSLIDKFGRTPQDIVYGTVLDKSTMD